jgi:hypothetical protein
VTVNGREYNLDYKEQTNRTIIAISSSEMYDEQDENNIMTFSELLSKTLRVDRNPKLPRMLFVQKIDQNGNGASVPIEELRATVKACLKEL